MKKTMIQSYFGCGVAKFEIFDIETDCNVLPLQFVFIYKLILFDIYPNNIENNLTLKNHS